MSETEVSKILPPLIGCLEKALCVAQMLSMKIITYLIHLQW